MQEVFIVDARRTPFGAYGGALAEIPATELASQVMRTLLDDHGLAGDVVDEVILGQVLQGGCGQAPARQAARGAKISDRAHAMTVNKVCGSGLKTMMLAAREIATGESELILAGGMESMSRAPYVLPTARFGQRMGHGTTLDLMLHDGLLDPYSGRHMGELTEEWILKHGISREAQDEYAARSYRLAQQALTEGIFSDELVPVTRTTRKGTETIDEDEEPGRGNPDKLSGLRAVFSKTGSITAGNASTLNDGAAVALLAGEAALKKHGLVPRARLLSQATHSIDPALFAEAPVEAIRTCVRKAGLKLSDIDLFEINEAFAAVPLVACKELEIPLEKVNVRGGAVALGHPIGASGGRLMATLLRELHARGARYGVAALCIGGGEAVATLVERI